MMAITTFALNATLHYPFGEASYANANSISARPFTLSYTFIAGTALIRSKNTLLKAKLTIPYYVSRSEYRGQKRRRKTNIGRFLLRFESQMTLTIH